MIIQARIVLFTVAEHFGFPPDKLLSVDRHQSLHLARKVTMHLMRKHSRVSLNEIGRAIGRHHSSVLFSLRAINKQMADDPDLRTVVAEIEGRLMKRAS